MFSPNTSQVDNTVRSRIVSPRVHGARSLSDVCWPAGPISCYQRHEALLTFFSTKGPPRTASFEMGWARLGLRHRGSCESWSSRARRRPSFGGDTLCTSFLLEGGMTSWELAYREPAIFRPEAFPLRGSKREPPYRPNPQSSTRDVRPPESAALPWSQTAMSPFNTDNEGEGADILPAHDYEEDYAIPPPRPSTPWPSSRNAPRRVSGEDPNAVSIIRIYHHEEEGWYSYDVFRNGDMFDEMQVKHCRPIQYARAYLRSGHFHKSC